MIMSRDHTQVSAPVAYLTTDESDLYLDELDDVSRAANAAQNRRQVSVGGGQRRNHSPQGVPGGVPLVNQPTDFDLQDISQDFMDASMGGNSTVSALRRCWSQKKRKAQNRAAQRAFRERKERHVKDLEAKVAEMEQVTNKMQEENAQMKSKLAKLEAENSILKGSNYTFTFPVYPRSNW
jgi:hypothetical protein